MHTAELDSAVHHTAESGATNISFFRFFEFVFSFNDVLQKTSKVKKIPQTIFDLQYNFHINIFRRHREIAFVQLRIKTETW